VGASRGAKQISADDSIESAEIKPELQISPNPPAPTKTCPAKSSQQTPEVPMPRTHKETITNTGQKPILQQTTKKHKHGDNHSKTSKHYSLKVKAGVVDDHTSKTAQSHCEMTRQSLQIHLKHHRFPTHSFESTGDQKTIYTPSRSKPLPLKSLHAASARTQYISQQSTKVDKHSSGQINPFEPQINSLCQIQLRASAQEKGI
jgi:hypothetical protein